MLPEPGRSILVTGSHRSGTTWVGRTLARSSAASWVAEPFHPRHRRGVFGARFPHWYEYLTDENAGPWTADLDALFAARYRCWCAVGDIRRPADAARALRDAARFARRRLTGQRAIVKDPIAFFSTPWLADRFGLEVVAMVRHPAAFAWSLQRLDWRFDFANWLDQPLLMRDLLAPYAAEIERLHAVGRDGRSIVEEAALVWRVLYSTLGAWQDEHPEWHVIRHEDLSADPMTGFAALFAALDMEFTPSIRAHVAASTGSHNPVGAGAGRAHSLARDSRANRRAWADHLDDADVALLRDRVGAAADRWYPDW